MLKMNQIVAGLGTFVGRDSCIRVTSYFALFLYGILTEFDLNALRKDSILVQYIFLLIKFESIDSIASSCLVISKQFAVTRLITRFFDDVPAIYNLYKHFKIRSDVNKNNNKNTTKRANNLLKVNGIDYLNSIFIFIESSSAHTHTQNNKLNYGFEKKT